MTALFHGGQLFDGANDPLTGHGVLVDGGKIARIAPAGEFEGFDGPRVDFSGGTLLPGLMDCHVHFCLGGEPDPGAAVEKLNPAALALSAMERAQATLMGGVVAVRDCGGKDYIEVDVRDALKSGRFVGPVMRASGRMICMTGGHGNRMARIADGVDEVIKAVRENVHRGVDVIKIMATGGILTPGVNPEDAHYSAEEMLAGVTEAHRFHKRTASHAQGAEGILNAVRAGIHSIEHGIFMNERCLAEMLERGTFLVPTLSAVANILRNKDKGIPDWAIEKCERAFERHKQSFRMFYEAGGRIAMGTDAGTPFNHHGDNAKELAYMVENGMTPRDALIAATSAAADLIDCADRGRIAEGFVADFLIVEGDPLADISAVADRANHRAVYKDARSVVGAGPASQVTAPMDAAASL